MQQNLLVLCCAVLFLYLCRGADKSFVRPGRKQATATEDFEFHEEDYYYLHIYNKTSIKRNILTIKQNPTGSKSV
jgi:hypothetical protein